ncbi:class I SAM-dependent methyltransferase [Streptomyces sp. URMC 123]|uniref:class I SAM-dependent methyltransferase n=1 Tax=Streptomyces sp. URMC 123 TaxID=3423403 RepID=UPI003F1BAA3F
MGESRRRLGIPRDAVHRTLLARWYAWLSARVDGPAGIAAHRRELLAGLSGRVIEIGAGSGLGFAHYPTAVSEVVAIEPERVLRRFAVEAALRAEVPVDVVPGSAEALPVKSEAFDAAVTSMALCGVRDLPRALGELRRVLRPGGELRFLEPVRSEGRLLATAQWALDRTVLPWLLCGLRAGRDPVAALTAAGFEVEARCRLRVPSRLPLVLGVARRPVEPSEPTVPVDRAA